VEDFGDNTELSVRIQSRRIDTRRTSVVKSSGDVNVGSFGSANRRKSGFDGVVRSELLRNKISALRLYRISYP